MQHLGDITKIYWSLAPPVDCVTGGSPCQDLSIAGKRQGLDGERSGLYMDQIKCIKELRKADEQRGRTGEFIRPRYMVWENVVGAFSSREGKDFAAVLTEAVRVIEPDAPDVPVPEKGWSYSGTLMGEGWSIAWRTHDAKYWGVPQRRRRISLVCDFGGATAPEVLFECKSVSGHSAEGKQAREEAARTSGMGIEGAVDCADCNGNAGQWEGNPTCGGASAGKVYAMRMRSGCPGGGKGPLIQTELSGTLGTGNDQTIFCLQVFRKGTRPHGKDEAQKWERSEVANTLNTFDIGEQRASELVLCIDCRNSRAQEVSGTLKAKENGGKSLNYINPVFCIGNGQTNQGCDVIAGSLNCMHDQQCILNIGIDLANMVRRLTPLECERLQGFPDGWTDIGEWVDSNGKKHKDADSLRYKALGNSIALPFWYFLSKRISAQYTYRPTLGSLFDGIGGFPLCWESINGKGTALWASEIDEFPMATTRIHFEEEQ